MARTFDQKVAEYARLVIHSGINIREGQELILIADVEEAPFARLLADEAYRSGALHVHMAYVDDLATLGRYNHGSSEALAYAPKWLLDTYAERMESGAAYLRVYGSDPSLLKGIAPEKIAAAGKAQSAAGKRLQEAVSSWKSNWTIVGHASRAWAQTVFPSEPVDVAVDKLWDAIFACCHVGDGDAVASWNNHCKSLESRKSRLNERNYSAVHFTGNGTDLKVGLAEGHQWCGGRVATKDGGPCSPNIPTEEVFCMPHRERVEGVVRSSKPLSLRGSIVDGIEMTFEKGVATKATAREGESVLLGLLDTDEGAKRLGEVALVPNSSGVSRSGLLFFNTLYDENAACHIAMGNAIGENLRGFASASSGERKERGMNDSLIHTDWMIGSASTDVDGITQDGRCEPLMRAGEWVA